MLSTILSDIFDRDLKKVVAEINAYPDETKLWVVEKGISNSAGNLCLHLIGNLNHFVGATLGGTGYVRDRDSEFSKKNVPRAELLSGLEKTIGVVKTTLGKLTEGDLERTFPFQVGSKDVPTAFMLVNLTAHLDYHLGQINYHRRLLG